jgi:hypothetical protein
VFDGNKNHINFNKLLAQFIIITPAVAAATYTPSGNKALLKSLPMGQLFTTVSELY